jgi:hypothetical protein
MPGGGGAFKTGCVAASRSLACCSGVSFGDVPVFGMMSWMPIELHDMNVTSNSDGKISQQLSTICVGPEPNPTLPGKVLLTVPGIAQA